MFFLYSLEFIKTAFLVIFHDRVSAEVTLREDSGSFSEIRYSYRFSSKDFDGEKLYRFPETLFLDEIREGENLDVLVYPSYPFFSLPVKLLWFEVLLTTVFVVLSALLTKKAWTEKKKYRSPLPSNH